MTARSQYWADVAHLQFQLETCADHGGYLTLNQQQAQTLLDEIHQLRRGRNVIIELPSGRTHTNVPPDPDREGQQFEDRDGNVWTWTRWTDLPEEHRRASGGHNRLVRETDHGEDDVLPWADAWASHGPLWLLPEFDRTGQVALRAEIIVNGHLVRQGALVDELLWERYGSDLHNEMKADLRRRLANGLVEDLNPPVSVQRAPRWLREHEARLRDRYIPPAAEVTDPT